MRIGYLILILALLITLVVVQETTPEPTSHASQPTEILFLGNTCLPPCWANLIAGISTNEDVDRVMLGTANYTRGWRRFHQDPWLQLSSQTLALPVWNGKYQFVWRYRVRDSQIISVLPNWISVQGGIVSEFLLYASHDVTLGEALEIMGQPDLVEYGVSTGEGIIGNLNLIYI